MLTLVRRATLIIGVLALMFLLGDYVGGDGNLDYLRPRAWVIALLAVGLYAVLKMADKAAENSERERKRAQEKQREDDQRVRAAAAWRQRLGDNLLANAQGAIRSFESMPRHMDAAEQSTREALSRYRDGVIPLFWSSIEAAYAELAGYQAAALAIEQASRRHVQCIRDLVEAGVDPSTVARFPVSLNVAHSRSTVDDATKNLQDIAYEALKNPNFATIWEQRRTTAAVIEGFANLESAVAGMRSAVVAAVGQLGRALDHSNHDVATAISRMSSSMVSISSQQATEMNRLNSTAGKIHDELYHQKWGHYPMLG